MQIYSDKIVALVAWYNNEHVSAMDESDGFTENDANHLYDEVYELDGCEFMVLTDNEANEKWDESLENYIEECILPEVPESFRNYFDNEKWKRDARVDGRGHSLSLYDGEEHEIKVNNEWYYIYRIN